MPIITSIKPQENNSRVNIYLDGKFGFGLDLENFVLLGLKVEQELSDEEIENITQKGEFQKFYNKLLDFATRRPRSEKEIIDWYYRKKVPKKLQTSLLQKLAKFGFLDDEAFAKWWVEQRLQFKFKSKKELEYELKSKGIDKDVINRVIDESLESGSEEKTAMSLLEKKLYRWEKLDKITKKRKMSEFLARKGFSWDTVNKAVKKLSD